MKRLINGHLVQGLLEPVSSALNVEAARKLIGLRANARTRARVAKLALKCNEGKLTADERDEYETYVLVGEFIALLQAEARLLLARRGHPA